jgi:peptidoglycan/LPS O-acetylase OafA/YrhL
MLGNLLRRKIVVTSITTVLIIIGFIVPHLYDSVSSTSPLDQLIFATFADRGAKLYVAFLLGIAAYLYRDRLPYSWWLFGGCVAFCLGLSAMRPAPWMTVPLLNLIVAPVTVYMTVFIGATRIPRLPIYGRGDYSYGIYLYGVPIQQSVRAALPFTDTALLNLLFSIPLITLFAMFSWHCIEKPILRLRKRFSFVARVRGVEGPGESKVGAPSPGA